MKKPIFQTVVLSAPPGWGKTHNHKALRMEHRCSQVIDGWTPGDELTPGALHITSARRDQIDPALFDNASYTERGWT